MMTSNAVGRKAQKCSTSRLLDELFPDPKQVGSFSIPLGREDILEAQLSSALPGKYQPMFPASPIATSLEAAARHGDEPCEEGKRHFIPSEDGWRSRLVSEG